MAGRMDGVVPKDFDLNIIALFWKSRPLDSIKDSLLLIFLTNLHTLMHSFTPFEVGNLARGICYMV